MDDYVIPLKTPCVYYDENFLTKEEATRAYDDLLQNTAWEKTAKINRWVALHEAAAAADGSDVDDDDAPITVNYQYRDAPSKTTNDSSNNKDQRRCPPFSETIQFIKQKAEEWYNQRNHLDNKDPVSFNVCLLNFYEDGTQRIGWHSDREEIGRSTPICSISLGATRDFQIRAKEGGMQDRATIALQHGSLVVMENACQMQYVHSIPKQAHVTQGRINLTFRCKAAVTETTAGEEEHERRDRFLIRMAEFAAETDNTTAATTPGVCQHDTADGYQNVYVFGDVSSEYKYDDATKQRLLKSAVYMVTTNIGAEHYTVAEMGEVLDATLWSCVPRPWGAAGYVAVCFCGNEDQDDTSDNDEEAQTRTQTTLLKLRSAHHVMRHHDSFTLQDVLLENDKLQEQKDITGEDLYEFYKQRLVDGKVVIESLQAQQQNEQQTKTTFRVTCDRIGGPHSFRGPDVEMEVGGAMSEYYVDSCKPQMQDYDVHVRVDVIGSNVMIGTQLNVQELSRQRSHCLRYRNSVTIKCNLAYCMLKCANLEPGQVLVDPYCGSGTILLEALELWQGKLKCIGMDINRKAAQGARENALAENYGEDICQVHCADQRAIQKIVGEESSVDAIVTNLPWGIMTGRNVKDLQSMYEIFLRTSWYVLKPGGRIVMFVLRGLQMTRIVRKLGGRYRLLRVQVIRTANNLPSIVVIEKLVRDEMNDSIKSQLAYMSQYVNISRELYHDIHMEKIDEGVNGASNKNKSDNGAHEK